MSEEQQEYKTDALAEAGYVKEAIEMLRGQPAAIIDPPRNVKALSDKGIVDYQVWGWVKLSAKFLYHIKVLKGAKLAIMMSLALSVDESGKCKRTIKQICELTGYSHTEVIDSLKELDVMGYVTVQRDARGNIYNPEFVARGELSPTDGVVKKLDSTPAYQVESSPSEENVSPSIKRVKRVNGIESAIFGNRPVEQTDLPEGQEALQAFERDMQLPASWTWFPAKSSMEADWKSLRDFLVKTYQQDSQAFTKYHTWRSQPYARGAMSNRAIKNSPADFELSYSDYLASSAMYGNKSSDKSFGL